jgi:hypothetical protein
MPPSDAKRMSSRVGVCLVALVGREIGGRLEQASSERHRLLVRSMRIFDVEIEVDLLRAAVRPVRTDVVRCELNADPPFAGGVNDAVPTLVFDDAPVNERGPERALLVQVCCVEDDNLAHHSHRRIIGSNARHCSPLASLFETTPGAPLSSPVPHSHRQAG